MTTQAGIKTNCDVPAVWQTHKNELRNFILKRVKDQDLTNDILQDVLIKVYNFCISNSGVRNIRSWLFQITQNTITDHYRKQKKFTGVDDLTGLDNEDENAAFAEATTFILPMLNFLPEEYAIPLKLSDLDHMKQADIAKKLNLGLSATKSRIQRARKLLKAEFVTCCHFETDKQGSLISFQIKKSCEPLQKIIKKTER
ncbi:RNA polymerase sigma factor SigZ [Psychroflexus sp. YR1-1]|uniref:RNA polymerase sigma factor SigZ n=1 Tax=Psychroflexus aurantiacus TaxID=2709310 RepID=A0A6B3R4A5_9FLAO|nr:RNA polymerase sigma factor SigZ [Psychroflexus aurantiacus]NEV93745.1 RNA polymerase sigma factor SigZ [Psychroflexus aurantiacus]